MVNQKQITLLLYKQVIYLSSYQPGLHHRGGFCSGRGTPPPGIHKPCFEQQIMTFRIKMDINIVNTLYIQLYYITMSEKLVGKQVEELKQLVKSDK